MEVKPGYKMTEVGVIPYDWEVAALETVAETSSGTTPLRALFDRYYRRGCIPWVKTLDLNNSYLADTDERVTDLAMKETSLRLYPVGSVLVAMYGGFKQIGRTALLQIPAVVNQAITAVIPNKQRLDSNYLLRTLNFRIEYWKAVASSSRKDPNITGKEIRGFPLPLPSKPEQEAIAGALSDADALIASLEQLVAKKRQIKHGTMQQLLTGQKRLPGFQVNQWKGIRLGNVVTLQRGFDLPHRLRKKGDVPIVTSSGIEDTHFEAKVTAPGVVTGRYGTIGEVFFVESDFWPLNTTLYVRQFHGNDPRFVSYLLRTIDFATHSGKSGVPGVNRNDLHEETVLIPPTVAEQRAITAVLSDMDAEIASVEAKLTKARLVKQGMMQELLTGRIRLVSPGSEGSP